MGMRKGAALTAVTIRVKKYVRPSQVFLSNSTYYRMRTYVRRFFLIGFHPHYEELGVGTEVFLKEILSKVIHRKTRGSE